MMDRSAEIRRDRSRVWCQARRTLFVLVVGSAGLVAGCARLTVESNPPGATVLWSPDGLDPYRPWPPNSWEVTRTDENMTPFSASGAYGDTFFVTVEKDGYRRPLPQVVQLHGIRHEKLSFELVETPDALARRMKAQGWLLYEGEWVDPRVADVVEYEGVVMSRADATRKEMQAKGMVEYEGDWMTPAQAKEREAVEMQAAGLVNYKGRWVKPEVASAEKRIDDEVKALIESKTYADLPAPRFVTRPSIAGSQVQIYNSSAQVVRFLFSGEISREYTLDPYKSMGVKAEELIVVPPGRYDIVVVPTGKDAAGRDLAELVEAAGTGGVIRVSTEPMWGSWPLPSGTLVSINYTGDSTNLAETLDDFQPPKTDLGIDVPQIEVPQIDLPKTEVPPQGGPGAGGGPPRRRPQ